MKRILVAAMMAAVSACATAPTDIAFDAAGASSGAADSTVSLSADSKDAVLILAIGPIGTGGAYEFQPLNADRTDFDKGGVILGFGAWGVGDKMKRPENEKSSVWVLNDEINFLIKKVPAGTYAATSVSWNTYNGYASGSAWFCQQDGAPTFDLVPGKINLLSSRDAVPPGAVTRLADKHTEADVLAQFERTRQNYPGLKGEPVIVYPTQETRWTEGSAGIMRVCGVAKKGTFSVNRIRFADDAGERDAADEAVIKAALENAAKVTQSPSVESGQ
jgi:hypothetical protein